MIDPLTSLSFAVYSNKGAYALLLGSGVSRSSGIPTGWEVVLDLIRKVAALEGEDCEPDPAKWFREKNKTEPDYSQLLDGIAKTATERQQLLRGYFEPTDEEREEGLKLPNAAHQAIARLVVSGHIRVILTTNFDRLTEKALEDVGISPTVISTADQIAGSMPLVHSRVTIIKLHGDYLDTRILNTESELTSYDKALDGLLDRVLDEYGLIVSGWSGDWDIALRAAIERCPTRRFTTFWATRSPLSERAESLAKHRQAQIVQSRDADQFFSSIEEKVQALGDLAAPHPLSAKIAVATVKRYLVDPSSKIRLHDLVHEEKERLFAALNDSSFEAETQLQSGEELAKRISKYEAVSDVLLSIVVTGCYWDGAAHTAHWISVLQRIADTRGIHGGLECLINLRHYPTLLFMYGLGIASVASENFHNLAAILTNPTARNDNGETRQLCEVVYPYAVIKNEVAHMMPGTSKSWTPISNHLHNTLRGVFRDYLHRDQDYDNAFDRFEYFLGLVNADLTRWDRSPGWYGPPGRNVWKDARLMPVKRLRGLIDREMELSWENWPLVKAGLFGGSIDRAKTAKTNYDTFLGSLNWM